mgnify:CR=1 FL=1
MSLLPLNSTQLERAIEAAMDDVPVIPIRTLYNAQTCPAHLLHQLAWAWSVDRWDNRWSEQVKRAAIESTFYIHSHKGTIGALRRVVEPLGYLLEVIEWWQTLPLGVPGTFALKVGVLETGITEEMSRELVALIDDAKPLSRLLTELVISLESTGVINIYSCVYEGEVIDVYPPAPRDIEVTGQFGPMGREHQIETLDVYSCAIGVVAAAFSAFKMGKGLVNIVRGVIGARDKNDVQKVFVTNADGSDDSRPDSKSSKLLNIAEIGLKALGGKKEEESEGEGDKKAGFDPIETGLKVLDVLREAKGDDEDTGPQKVFVVNAGDMGGGAGRGNRHNRGSNRNRNSRRRASGGRPPRPTVPAPGGAARAMNLVGKAGKVIPGAALFEGGLRILDTYQSAETQDAKAEGYGAAAGNMAGALAGAAAGAAIGSVVPVLGTAIGGVVGGILGSMGGETLGAMQGKSWFGSDTEKPPTAVPTSVPYSSRLTQGVPGAVNMGTVVRSFSNGPATGPLAMPSTVEPVLNVEPPKIQQKIDSSAPLQITVKGDVKDPAALARELQPHLQRHMEQFGQQLSNRNLYDEPHVG